MTKYKYSIIIPHKNTPDLLRRCVNTIPCRNDTQIIVVDDNSDPALVDFNHFPIKDNDHTIVIFDKSGKGAGRARNIGMEKASGEKYIFADADDFFNYCFNEILDEYKEDNSDIVFFNASSCDTVTYQNTDRALFRNQLLEGYKKDPKLYEYYLRYECGSPWSKIIRSELIKTHDIKFEESIIANDTKFSYMIGHYANFVKADQRAIYCVTVYLQSISYTLNDNKYLERTRIIAEQVQFINSLNLNISTPISFPTTVFLIKPLCELYESNRIDLYYRCIKILKSYNMGDLEKEVKKSLRRKKITNKLKKMVSFSRKLLSF